MTVGESRGQLQDGTVGACRVTGHFGRSLADLATGTGMVMNGGRGHRRDTVAECMTEAEGFAQQVD